MKSNEFLAEVLQSPLCPANFEKIYNEFRGYQQLALDTLKQFQAICAKHGIAYQMAYGSLLGAIRDGGQLPWDYDVDVLVPYEERDKLIDVLKSELSSEYYFRCPEVEKKCEYYFIRLAPKGCVTNVLHVDVFYLIGASDDDETRKVEAQQVAQCSRTRLGKNVNLKNEAAGDIKRYLSFLVKRKLPTLGENMENVDQCFQQLCTKYPLQKANVCITADIYAGRWEFPASMVRNTTLMDTDYGTISVPVQYDEILTQRYGNYMALPPLESRIRELMFHYKRIKYFLR